MQTEFNICLRAHLFLEWDSVGLRADAFVSFTSALSSRQLHVGFTTSE